MGILVDIYVWPPDCTKKILDVCPLVIGETWQRLIAKCLLRLMGLEATNTCQDYQLFAGLIVGIDGAVHGVQDIWDANLSTEDW